ncbi:G protein-coupled glucose receptor regulating Gpa2-domain-containing protein [Clohesyomyces aquaticus]|uniref:G protein-coupled glucose receptor regulating Gpa2-domain-containing protein n=1 Tax=Clohesyomyces aquaticus TaxID=1231657 RepID=A0A1Y2ABU0_9PLEO|nr:G protein-coupled glucose receptor regulating Gpa2-domain-containing protein [Clohesyomyces aquaticus]
MAHLEKRYFDYPHSLDPITPVFKTGLIPIAIFAVISLISVSALLGFITFRLISWRKHYKEWVGYNQYVLLIYNLLLADLQQSLAFAISFHWLRINKIVAPTAACFIQAWFLHIGDISSGFFVLAIAVHTWLGVVKGYKLPYGVFVAAVLGIWLFALILTIVGPIMYRDRFFARAGGWCWVSTNYERERLWLHYLWIFIVEFGTIAIYGHIFFHLKGRIRSILHNDTSKLTRATKFMILYPLAYVLLTLPIAVGRMVAMTGTPMPDLFFVVAGTLLTSCGWIDALLYTLTRRVLVSNQLSEQYHHTRDITALGTNAARPGDKDDYGLTSIHNLEHGPARTVTITGGSNRISRLDRDRGRLGTKKAPSLRNDSPTGSTDSIIKPNVHAIEIVTETNIQYETTHQSEESESDIISSPSRIRSRNHSESGFSTNSK